MAKAKRNSWTFNLLRVFIYALLFGGGLVLSAYLGLIFFQYYLTNDSLVLPDFRNQSLVEVINQISRLGLQSEIKRIENNPDLPPNWVIQQDPPPGVEIKKNHRVKLVINGGEGIAVATEGGVSSGSTATSSTATATATSSVPDVRQMSLEEAQYVIENSGLKVERIVEVTHDIIPAGYVVSQNPPPQSEVRKGSVVSLLVSKGKGEVQVSLVTTPDLVGLRLEEAKRLLAQNNLTVGNVEEVEVEGKSEGIVMGQSPSAGEQVEPGEKINLRVTKQPPEEETTGLKELTLRFALPSSRSPIEVKIVVNDEMGERIVYEKEHQGEEIVELVTLTKGEGKVFIYLNGYYYWDKTLN